MELALILTVSIVCHLAVGTLLSRYVAAWMYSVSTTWSDRREFAEFVGWATIPFYPVTILGVGIRALFKWLGRSRGPRAWVTGRLDP